MLPFLEWNPVHKCSKITLNQAQKLNVNPFQSAVRYFSYSTYTVVQFLLSNINTQVARIQLDTLSL